MMEIGLIQSAIERVKDGETSVEIVGTQAWPLSDAEKESLNSKPPFRIAVLDSSFNPPTRAHLALGASPYPHPYHSYDARLLLLSVRNADKVLKSGDATFAQRVQMMLLHAEELRRRSSATSSVAVAVINEPSFVGKSTKLLRFLRPRLPSHVVPHLAFVLGTDTVTRFFAPRFYASHEAMQTSIRQFFSPSDEGGDGSEIVCARRGSDMSTEQEEEFLASEEVKPYVDRGGIKMFDIGEAEMQMSSTKLREGRKAGNADWEAMCCESIADYIKREGLYVTDTAQ